MTGGEWHGVIGGVAQVWAQGSQPILDEGKESGFFGVAHLVKGNKVISPSTTPAMPLALTLALVMVG